MRDFSGGGIFPLPDVVARAKEREIPCIRKRGRFSRTSYFLSTETSDRESIVETRPLSLFARTLVEPSWVNNSSREYLRIKEPLYIYIYIYTDVGKRFESSPTAFSYSSPTPTSVTYSLFLFPAVVTRIVSSTRGQSRILR